MTKTISANSLNFANLYLLSNFLFSRIHWKYLHNNADMNGLHWSCIFLYFVLKDKLKQAGGHVHSVKQRIAAASRAWGINRYVDDLIICITLCKKGGENNPQRIFCLTGRTGYNIGNMLLHYYEEELCKHMIRL